MKPSSPLVPAVNELADVVVDGRYELVEEIGSGSMGVVYRARQLRLNRDVAVKLLHSDLGSDENRSARFEREARAVAKLKHPNCLTLHDFGYDEDLGRLFMVTELLRGQTLSDAWDMLSDLSRLQIGYYIADALKHAHSLGVIHRDLKPENVMLHFDDDGKLRLKVVDFGLALLFERAERDADGSDDTGGKRERRLTQMGQICGTPRYLSPEQCVGDLHVTTAADMYALGILLYELYEGVVPFPGPSVPEILLAHMHDEPPSMVSFPLVEVEQLIYDLLGKVPEERPTATDAREVFARHVDLTRSGVFDESLTMGLAEVTFGSDATDDELPVTEAPDDEPDEDEDDTVGTGATDVGLPPSPTDTNPNLPQHARPSGIEPRTAVILGVLIGVILTLIVLAVVYGTSG